MIRTMKLAVAGTIAIFAAGAANAQTLEQRDKIARDKVQLAEYSKRVNSACGTHIQFSINYASYQNAHAAANVRVMSPTEYLMNAGDALMNICVTEAGKQAVSEKIKSVVGMYTEGEEESLSNGVFTYKVGYTGGNVDNPEKWLKAHL